MKLKTRKSSNSKSKHLTAKYTKNFSTEKLIKDEKQHIIGVFFVSYIIIYPHLPYKCCYWLIFSQKNHNE